MYWYGPVSVIAIQWYIRSDLAKVIQDIRLKLIRGSVGLQAISNTSNWANEATE